MPAVTNDAAYWPPFAARTSRGIHVPCRRAALPAGPVAREMRNARCAMHARARSATHQARHAGDPRIQQRESPDFVAEHYGVRKSHPRSNVVCSKKVPGHPQLLEQTVNMARRGLCVVAVHRTIRITLSGKVRCDDSVGLCKQSHHFAPGEPALGKAREQHDHVALWVSTGDVVQPQSVDCRELVLESC